jgi:hypothetical protein
MTYVYTYVLACFIFALIYGIAVTVGYVLREKDRFKIEDNMRSYLTKGTFILAGYLLVVIVATVLCPVLLIEDIVKQRKLKRGTTK